MPCLTPFWFGGFQPTKTDHQKNGYPYSNSTGGPSVGSTKIQLLSPFDPYLDPATVFLFQSHRKILRNTWCPEHMTRKTAQKATHNDAKVVSLSCVLSLRLNVKTSLGRSRPRYESRLTLTRTSKGCLAQEASPGVHSLIP